MPGIGICGVSVSSGERDDGRDNTGNIISCTCARSGSNVPASVGWHVPLVVQSMSREYLYYLRPW